MLTTINALEERRPRFPADLRCKLAEMVIRRPELPAAFNAGSNYLMDLIPLVLFVDEGLSYFSQSITEYEKVQTSINALYTLYQTTKMTYRIKNLELSPVVQVALKNLNCLRSPELDAILHGNPVKGNSVEVLKSLISDLLPLSEASKAIATGIIHPIMDDSQEVKEQYIEGLRKVKGTVFNQQLKSVSQNLNESLNIHFSDTDEKTLIEPSSISQIWPIEENGLNSLFQLSDIVHPVVIENIGQLLDQILSLRHLHVIDQEVKGIILTEGERIKEGWSITIQQIKMLSELTGSYITIQEATLNFLWVLFDEMIKENNDLSFKTLLHASMMQILEDTEKNE